MKYLATIKQTYESTSKIFDTQEKAEDWLDSQNNNLEHTTIVTVYDDQWHVIKSYEYTSSHR